MPQASDPKRPIGPRPTSPPSGEAGGPASPSPVRSAPRHQAPAGEPAAGPAPADPRSRWIGLAAIGAAGVVAFVVTLGIFVPAIGALMSGTSSRASSAADLPAQLLVCDREYARDTLGARTLDELRIADGREPTVVSTPVAGCPADVCLDGGMCLPVVYARLADDTYVGYELQGGP